MSARFVLPYQTVVDAIGVPIPGAQLFFFVSGTSTPQNTYADSTLLIPNKNPVEANAAGVFPNIFMVSAPYKVVLTDSLLNQIWTADPVIGGGAGVISANRRAVAGSTIVLLTDAILEVDAGLGNATVTYPLALGTSGLVQPVTIIKTDATTNSVNIIDDGSGTVRATLNEPAIGASMNSAVVYSNGTALRIT